MDVEEVIEEVKNNHFSASRKLRDVGTELVRAVEGFKKMHKDVV